MAEPVPPLITMRKYDVERGVAIIATIKRPGTWSQGLQHRTSQSRSRIGAQSTAVVEHTDPKARRITCHRDTNLTGTTVSIGVRNCFLNNLAHRVSFISSLRNFQARHR